MQLLTVAKNLAILLILCALVKYAFVLFFINRSDNLEGFESAGEYPDSQKFPLLKDSYPLTGDTVISNNGAKDIWWHNPIFGVSSFKQITNNIRYNNNPDNGSCTPSQFCGSYYKDYQEKINTSAPLKPVPYGNGARVNFFRNKDYLLQFNNKDNILY